MWVMACCCCLLLLYKVLILATIAIWVAMVFLSRPAFGEVTRDAYIHCIMHCQWHSCSERYSPTHLPVKESYSVGPLLPPCSNAASLPDAYMAQVLGSLYPKLLSQSLYVGIWGNANTSLVDQWVQVGVIACNPALTGVECYGGSPASVIWL